MLKHAGNNFSYFDYNKKNKRSDRIKNDANVRKPWVASQFTEINSDTRAGRDAGNKAELDMSVRQVRF